MNARKLILIHADDDYPNDPQVISSTFLKCESIRGWRDAIKLWSSGIQPSCADLMVSDILFENDDGTPLAELGSLENHKPIPTGLSHLKPLAALARSGNRPVGVAMHSRYDGYWSKLLRANHPMGMLAAHECGELAAILGDSVEMSGDRLVDAENCLKWLEANSRTNIDSAIKHAIRNWRGRVLSLASPSEGLPTLFLAPSEYLKQLAWLDEMAQTPKPIGNRSVVLTRADGTEDEIFLASMFCDVPEAHSKVQRQSCFEYKAQKNLKHHEIVKLDDGGRPKIGQFLFTLGSLARVYVEAVDQASRLSIEPRLRQTNHAAGSGSGATDGFSGKFVKGLAAFLVMVRLEHDAYQTWQDIMNTVTGYKVEGKILTNEVGPTLGQVLSTLARLCKSTEGSFTTEDILQQCEYSRGNGQELNQNQTHSLNVRWLFDQLVEAGWLYNSDALLASSRVLSGSDSRGGYRRAVKSSSRFRLECLAVPADPPHGAERYGLNYRRSAVMEALKVSLEVGDDNQVNRMMAGLIGSDAPGGTALRARVLDGRGPQWLMALLQEYAINVLEWRPDHGWPSWLLAKSKNK